MEQTNMVWFGLGMYMLLILGRYIVMSIRDHGWRADGLPLAKSLFIAFLGVNGTRLAVLMGLNGYSFTYLAPALLACSLIATVGILCMCRVLSPDAWGHWGTVVPIGLTAVLIGCAVYT